MSTLAACGAGPPGETGNGSRMLNQLNQSGKNSRKPLIYAVLSLQTQVIQPQGHRAASLGPSGAAAPHFLCLRVAAV